MAVTVANLCDLLSCFFLFFFFALSFRLATELKRRNDHKKKVHYFIYDPDLLTITGLTHRWVD